MQISITTLCRLVPHNTGSRYLTLASCSDSYIVSGFIYLHRLVVMTVMIQPFGVMQNEV